MSEEEKKNYSKSKEYPAVPLSEAIGLILKLKNYPLDKPISYQTVANEFGYKNNNVKSLRYKISAARQFGLITTNGTTLTFTEPGKKIALPTDDSEEAQIKMQCFALPTMFQGLINSYTGRAIPQQTTLENIVVRDYGITQNAKVAAAKAFIKTAEEVGAIQSGVLNLEIVESTEQLITQTDNSDQDNNDLPNANNIIASQPDPVSSNSDFESLSIPLGQQRKAIMYMPSDATKEDAEYVKDMISVMFKRLYNITM